MRDYIEHKLYDENSGYYSAKNSNAIGRLDTPFNFKEMRGMSDYSKELNKIISEQNNVVIPNFEGKNGHPIKLGIDFWKNLCSLDLNDKSSRLDVQIKKINPNKISIIEVSDRVITLNINTKKDWKSFLEKNKVYFIIQTNL